MLIQQQSQDLLISLFYTSLYYCYYYYYYYYDYYD